MAQCSLHSFSSVSLNTSRHRVTTNDLENDAFFKFLHTTTFWKDKEIDQYEEFVEIIEEEDDPDFLRDITNLFHQFKNQQHPNSREHVSSQQHLLITTGPMQPKPHRSHLKHPHIKERERNYRIYQMLQDICDHFCLEDGVACRTNCLFWMEMCFDVLKIDVQTDEAKKFDFASNMQNYSFRRRSHRKCLTQIQKHAVVRSGTNFHHFIQTGEAFLAALSGYSWACNWIAFMIYVESDFFVDTKKDFMWERISGIGECDELTEYGFSLEEMQEECPVIVINEKEGWRKNMGNLDSMEQKDIFDDCVLSFENFSNMVINSDCVERTLVFSAERLCDGSVRAYVTFYGHQIRVRSMFQIHRLAQFIFGESDDLDDVYRRLMKDDPIDSLLTCERLLSWFRERGNSVL